MSDLIYTASTTNDYAAFAELIGEYVEWCRMRYQDDPVFATDVFAHQSLDAELKALSASYGPPNGKTLLASRDGKVCGGGAYRRLGDGVCEMKRLFVPTSASNVGIGRRLCNALIQSARDEGFVLMKLDTGQRLTEAIALYQSIGFKECSPYHDYPEKLLPYLLFMELPLAPNLRG